MFNFFKKKSLIKTAEIEISKDFKKQFMETYYENRVPVLIKNAAQNWPLMSLWNQDYIVANNGSYICTLVEDSRPASANSKTTLKNYFEKNSDLSTLTLENLNLKNKPNFLKDVKLPNEIFSEADIYRFFFYNSNQNQGTLPHNHGDAFNILQTGKKHWIFYDADKLLAPKGFEEMQASFKKYPSGSHIKQYFEKELKSLAAKLPDTMECIQKPGDIVYVPRGYAHAVLNLENVMGLVFETKPLR